MKKFTLLLLILLILAAGCGDKYAITNINSSGTNIICFGNSITEGVGASEGEDFPSLLARELDLPVINAGRSGDTSASGLARITADVLRKDPKIVIVEFGGNDFLRKVPQSETFNNIDQIVQKIQSAGAMVILVEIKTGPFQSYLKGYKKIARQRGALLIPNLLKNIMGNRQLMADSIHPNSAGNRQIAAKLLPQLKTLLSRNKQR